MERLLSSLALNGATYNNFYSPQNKNFYSKFRYCNLHPNERRIRLLRIHPSLHVDDKITPIKCDLLDNVSMADMKGM